MEVSKSYKVILAVQKVGGKMIFCIICCVIGFMIFGAGIYYFIQERKNAESRKIYAVTAVVGAVIIALSVFSLICHIIF